MGTRDGPSSVRLHRDAGRSISVTMEALCLLLPVKETGDFDRRYQLRATFQAVTLACTTYPSIDSLHVMPRKYPDDDAWPWRGRLSPPPWPPLFSAKYRYGQ